ncbi:MAG: SRPBCC domain-containing protein, partial [Streptosporangiaceae bacterium]
MAGLVIEREVLIEAPAEVVWRTITEPDQMSHWFADRVELVVEPGAHGFMQFGDQGGPVVVETVDPPARFSFRWNHPRGEEPVA